jgi:hypothetical protein
MEQINKRPLVVILQEITKREIGRKDNQYVYLDNKQVINSDVLDEAITKQNDYLLEDSRDGMNKAIQGVLDTKAVELRYDNMMSVRSYAGYDNPFQDEAIKLATWCGDCWIKAGEIEADVASGDREMPTVDEVLAELPTYE